MKKIQTIASSGFIIAVSILGIVSILGVWKIFSNDVIIKSFETLGLLAVISIIVIFAGKFIDNNKQSNEVVEVDTTKPVFKTIRHLTLTTLIISVSILALFGILAIWDVITDKDFIYKVVGSVSILAFCSLIIVMTCLNQEGNDILKNRKISGGTVFVVLFVIWILFSFFTSVFRF